LRNLSISLARPRASLAFTVPTGTLSVSAALCIEKSSRCRRRKAARWEAGSVQINLVTISRTSHCSKLCSGVGLGSTSNSAGVHWLSRRLSLSDNIWCRGRRRKRIRSALVTIAMSQVDICARPSNREMFLKADSSASWTASSASSALRSQCIAILRKRGSRCDRIFSNSRRRSGLASPETLRVSPAATDDGKSGLSCAAMIASIFHQSSLLDNRRIVSRLSSPQTNRGCW